MKRILTISILLLAVIVTVQADRRRLLMTRTVAVSGGISSPTEIANLFGWYKSDALVTNTAGTSPPAADDGVMAWGDSSGNSRHLRTNNVHGTFPLFKSAAQTSKSQGGIQFASTTNMLRVGFTAQADTTMFVLWRNANVGVYNIVLDSTNSSARQALLRKSTDLFTIFSGTEQTAAGAIPNSSWNILCGVYNSAGNDSMYTNGVVASTSLSSGNQSLDGLTVGAANDGTSALGNAGYVGEIIIYSRNLNSTEIGQVMGYLNTRWSVY